MPTAAIQRYHVIEKLDAGGMAEVFKAKVVSLQGFEKLVAIKRILPHLTQDTRFVRMFLDEAKLSLYLNHANIVQVFDIGHADGTYFIVMEFVQGVNLKHILNALLQSNQFMPVEQAVFVISEICKGLAYAHERRSPEGEPLFIVHRDISPPNILLSHNGEIKLTDFGLAKAVVQIEKTDPGIVKGKFGYLSPEAANGEEVDLLSDIFALGICLWEMLASRRLFLGDTDLDTLQQVRKAKVPPIRSINPEVPAALEAIIQKALHKKKSQRYASAQEFGNALTQFLFSHGKAVTNYNISQLIETLFGSEHPQVIKAQPAAATPSQSSQGVIDILIQNEIDKFISIEELEDLADLNLVGARPLQAEEMSLTGTESFGSLPAVGFEDPRTWSDIMGDDGERDLRDVPPAIQARPEPQTIQMEPTAGPPHGRLISQGNSSPRIQRLDPEPNNEDGGSPPKIAWIIFGILLVLLLAALGFLILTVIQA